MKFCSQGGKLFEQLFLVEVLRLVHLLQTCLLSISFSLHIFFCLCGVSGTNNRALVLTFHFHLVCSYSYLAPKLPLGLAMTHLTEMSCGRPTTTELLLVTSKFRSQITYVVVVLKVCLCLHGRWWRNRSYHKMRILCRNKTQMMMNHLEEMRIVYILNYQFRGGLMFCNAWVFDRLCNLLLSQCCSCVLDVQRGCARRNIFVLPYF